MSALFAVAFVKGKQLTRRHENGTTKPQQGERNSLKAELGGMSYCRLRWLNDAKQRVLT